MATPKGRRVAIATGILVILTLASAGIIFRDHIKEWVSKTLKAKKAGVNYGKPVYITEGEIPLVDFLKFLSEYTDLPLIYDSSDPSLASKEILIAANIPEADEEIVRAILEINGYRVYRAFLPSGKEVLKVEKIP